ncbi:MAG: NERD domain-containing protein [Promethearchaeota archaeon]
MKLSLSIKTVKHFFSEIYKILKETDTKVTEIWVEFSEVNFFKGNDESEIGGYLCNFESICIKKGNYKNYIVIDKIIFIVESIQILEEDIGKLSALVDFTGFEALVEEILKRNNYKTIKNFRFSDRSNFKSKTSQKRYEIDVVGISKQHILLIDAKMWKNKDSYSAMNKAANHQYQRALALQLNPEIFSSMFQDILGISESIERRPSLPFVLVPVMVSLEQNHIKFNENDVPLVSIYQFNSFLQELTINMSYFKTIKINKLFIQKQLSTFIH